MNRGHCKSAHHSILCQLICHQLNLTLKKLLGNAMQNSTEQTGQKLSSWIMYGCMEFTTTVILIWFKGKMWEAVMTAGSFHRVLCPSGFFLN